MKLTTLLLCGLSALLGGLLVALAIYWPLISDLLQ